MWLPSVSVWTRSPALMAGIMLSHLGEGGVLPDDLAAQIDENLVHVRPPSRRGFVIRRVSPALGHGECFGSRHGSVVLQIGLITNDDQRDLLVIFDPHNLLPKLDQLAETVETCDGEYQKESLACAKSVPPIDTRTPDPPDFIYNSLGQL